MRLSKLPLLLLTSLSLLASVSLLSCSNSSDSGGGSSSGTNAQSGQGQGGGQKPTWTVSDKIIASKTENGIKIQLYMILKISMSKMM